MSTRPIAEVADELTDGQLDMVRVLLEGQDLLDIARDWRMGIPKVEAYLAPAFAKLGVADAAELRERFTL